MKYLKTHILIFLLIFPILGISKTRVWVDYDMSMGKLFKDVDDGYALVHALMSRDSLDIVGLSSGFGNTDNMRFQEKMTRRILNRMNITDIPFYTGASYKSDLGKMTDATEALIAALEKGTITIMAMGRMTNIASVVLLRPDLISNIKEVIVNAGRKLEYSTYFGPRGIVFPDTNVDGHVEAVKVLQENQVPLTMIPTESMTDILITKYDIRFMKRQGGLLRWLGKKGSFWRFMWRIFPGVKGFIPWDVFIISYITHPHVFECERNIPYEVRELKNNTHSLFRWGRSAYKDFLVSSYDLDSSSLGTYCTNILPEFKKELLEYWSDRNIINGKI